MLKVSAMFQTPTPLSNETVSKRGMLIGVPDETGISAALKDSLIGF